MKKNQKKHGAFSLRACSWIAAGVFAIGCATTQSKDQLANNATQITQSEDASNANQDEAFKDPQTGKIVTEDGRVLVCRNETPTGTHLPRKICRWEKDKTDRRNNDQREMRGIQRKAAVNLESGG